MLNAACRPQGKLVLLWVNYFLPWKQTFCPDTFVQSLLFYISQAAQEKEELQREGDSLDAKINKAEKEIYALENTLQVLRSCNNNYKQSFKKVTPSSM